MIKVENGAVSMTGSRGKIIYELMLLLECLTTDEPDMTTAVMSTYSSDLLKAMNKTDSTLQKFIMPLCTEMYQEIHKNLD